MNYDKFSVVVCQHAYLVDLTMLLQLSLDTFFLTIILLFFCVFMFTAWFEQGEKA